MRVYSELSLSEIANSFGDRLLKANALAAMTAIAAHAHTTTNGWDYDILSFVIGWLGIAVLAILSLWLLMLSVLLTMAQLEDNGLIVRRKPFYTGCMKVAVMFACMASTFTVISTVNGFLMN